MCIIQHHMYHTCTTHVSLFIFEIVHYPGKPLLLPVFILFSVNVILNLNQLAFLTVNACKQGVYRGLNFRLTVDQAYRF